MRASAHVRAATRSRGRRREVPPAMFHAPLPGEDVELFSDRMEDEREYEAIVHEFESLHDADCAS